MRTNQATLMAFCRQKCKEYNLRITPQRSAIYKELINSKDHPSAGAIFKKARNIFPDVSFDTVNRTLLTFAEIGIVSTVEGYGEPKRFDPDTKSHHHFRCIKCNNIIDFQHAPYDKMKIPGHIQNQFTVLNERVLLEGICDKCGRKRSHCSAVHK